MSEPIPPNTPSEVPDISGLIDGPATDEFLPPRDYELRSPYGRQVLDDGSIPLRKLTQERNDPGERGVIAHREYEEREARHSALVNKTYNLEAAPERIDTIPFEGTYILQTDNTKTLSNADLHTMGLPELAREERPVALIRNGNGDKASMCLLSMNEQGGISKRYLLDPDFGHTSAEAFPSWVMPGDSFPVSNMLDEISISKKGDFIKIDVDPDSLDDAVIVKGQTTKQEKAMNAVRPNETKRKKARRRAIGASAFAGVMGVVSLLPSGESVPNEGRNTYEQIQFVDDEARQAMQESLDLYLAGDIDALKAIVASSEFGTSYIDQSSFEAVKSANSYSELETVMDEALARFGVDFVIPEDTDHRSDGSVRYTPLALDQLDDSISASLGILDYYSEFGFLQDEDVRPDVALVDSLPDKDTPSESNGGHYDSNTTPPIIRIAVSQPDGGLFGFLKDIPDVEERVKRTLIHEQGHDLSLNPNIRPLSISSVSSMNPEGFTYREVANTGELRDTELEVGSDVPTDYAQTNPKEDVAEVVEFLFSGDVDTLVKEDNSTVLSNKALGVLQDLEEEYPGISAKVFSMALEKKSDSSLLGKTDTLLRKAGSQAHENSLKIMLGSLLLALHNSIIAARSAQAMELQSTGKTRRRKH